MRSTFSDAQISEIFVAIRQTNFSDSITHGPRMNAGRFPPMETLPTFSGLAFIDRTHSPDAGDGGQSPLTVCVANRAGRGGSHEPPADRLTRSKMANGAYNARKKSNATP